MRFGEPQLLGDVQHERRHRRRDREHDARERHGPRSAAAATISAGSGRVLKVVTNAELAEIEAALGR